MIPSLISFISSAIIIFLTPENPTYLKFKNDDQRSLGYPISYYEGEQLTEEMIEYRIRVIKALGKFLVPTITPLMPNQPLPAPPMPPCEVAWLAPGRSKIKSDFLCVTKNQKTNRYKVAKTSEGQSIKVKFTKQDIEKFKELSFKYYTSEMSIEELVLELRGGGEFHKWLGRFGIGLGIIVVLNNADAFQPNMPGRVIVPPHLQWLYDKYKPGQDFGYGKSSGSASLVSSSATENAGDYKPESSGSYDYIETMRELERQSSKKRIDIRVGHEMYTIQNPYKEEADELQFKLGEKIYDSIRESDTDICDIAQNLGFKADNIKNVKDHVFYSKHELDRYGPEDIEYKRFDATLEQGLAWKRLEAGVHTPEDITWIKHECAERHHELKYGSGYSEAHDRAQTLFDGAPWNDKF